MSKVPDLIDALVASCSAALPSVFVADGYAVTDDPKDRLEIGVDSPSDSGSAIAATAVQTFGPMGLSRPRDETAEVHLAASSVQGGGNQKAARDAVYAIAAAVESLLRSDPSLGVAGVRSGSFGSTSTLSQDQTPDGAVAVLTFSITFVARI